MFKNPVYVQMYGRATRQPVANVARAMEEDLGAAQQSISDYQKGWNDSACGRVNPDLASNHAYRMGRADREAYRAPNR